MIPGSRNGESSVVPNATTRLDEAASEHLVTLLTDGLERQGRREDARVLILGMEQGLGSNTPELVLQVVMDLQARSIDATAYSTDEAAQTLAPGDDAPTDCYDAIVLFAPLSAIEGVGLDDLLSSETEGQLLVDVVGSVEPAAVAQRGGISVTYGGL
ncbi:hypothetical protein [Haloarchaeobius sp. DFWS5]|uniref:hypothetical protein n=1 Tax=Haloarchaeobius sp. DFWS5 TaxID=3446114 RepID=UPI003EBCA612